MGTFLTYFEGRITKPCLNISEILKKVLVYFAFTTLEDSRKMDWLFSIYPQENRTSFMKARHIEAQ